MSRSLLISDCREKSFLRVGVWRIASISSSSVVLSLLACSGRHTVAPTPPVTRVVVTPDSVTLGIRDSLLLSAVTEDATGQALRDRPIMWSSSDTSIVTVGPGGRIIAMNRGVASAIASSEGKSDSAHVLVTFPFGGLSVGAFHSCDLKPSDQAYCWGRNEDYELGNRIIGSATTPVPVEGNYTFISLASGRYHTCGLTVAKRAYCWGSDMSGQVGINYAAPKVMTPVPVNTGLDFVLIAANGLHTCALTASGDAYCWGSNSDGQLGDRSTTDRYSPVRVVGGLKFKTISLGGSHTCALTQSGVAYCWGHGRDGELGNNTTLSDSVPVMVGGPAAYLTISSGYSHTCAVSTTMAAYCWGDNTNGELGNGVIGLDSTPVPVTGGLAFLAVTAGQYHSCGIAADSAGYCWGYNFAGQLGNNSSAESHAPVPVSGGLHFMSVGAGAAFSCGLTTDGWAYCWGQGPLGAGVITSSLVPLPVVGQH